MGEIPCDSRFSEICKYAPNCHVSEHHRYPRSIGRRAINEALQDGNTDRAQLVKRFIEHPFNKIVACRRIHDFLDIGAPDCLPDEANMHRLVDESH